MTHSEICARICLDLLAELSIDLYYLTTAVSNYSIPCMVGLYRMKTEVMR